MITSIRKLKTAPGNGTTKEWVRPKVTCPSRIRLPSQPPSGTRWPIHECGNLNDLGMDINTTPQRTVVQLLPQACSVPFSSNASTPPTLQSEGCNNELIRGVTASSTDPNHFPDCVIDYSHDPLTFWMSQLGCTTGQFLLFEMRRPRRIPVVWIRTGHHPCAPKDITVSGSRGEPTGPWVALCHGTAECVDPWQRFGIADRTLLETEFRWVRVFFDTTHMGINNQYHVMCSGVKFWD